MPAPHPKEFRDDVVAVARKGEAPIAQVAHDFGISESCLRNWLRQADVEDGVRPGSAAAENAELREARRKIRLLEQENRGAAPGRGVPVAGEPAAGSVPKLTFPLVLDQDG
jgi:transposase-like protein